MSTAEFATVITKNTVQAWQWDGKQTKDLPAGVHVCEPEIHYSVGRKDVYFTYAELRSTSWITATPLNELPGVPFCGSVMEVRRKDGTKYWRQVFPFAFWSVKSEASEKRDHTAKFMTGLYTAENEAFLDYADLHEWSEEKGHVALPPRLEHRLVDGAYGRGYKPTYIKPGQWLVVDGRTVKAVDEL